MTNLKMIRVVGFPFDENASFKRGPALAPEKIRQAFYCDSGNLWTENGLDLGNSAQWQMGNDVDLSNGTDTVDQIEIQIKSHLEHHRQVISLGGDHSITYPIIRSYAAAYPDLNILHLDAHPDLYDSLDGNRLSHACPFARIMEENRLKRLVQVGIRTLNGHQREQARRFGVEIIDMKQIKKAFDLSFDGPVYLSLDMDCLDPAFAPGVSHYEPGGMSTREVLSMIQNLDGDLVGADIVEYNPTNDVNGMTAYTGAKLLKEILAKMLE